MINDVRISLEKRIEEIEQLINYLDSIESKKGDVVRHLSVFPALKASAFVMLYNAIESTTYLLFESLFDSIVEERIYFFDLALPLQEQYNRYRTRIKDYSDSELVTVEFHEYLKCVKLFSGNLDARSIRELLENWGISNSFHVKGEEKLLVIKNYRNALAHGERSFNEIGRNYAISEIKKFCKICDVYLNELIRLFSIYIDNEKYRCIK